MESIKTLIRQGEHQQQDFKFRIDDSRKIARTLSAFANTDGGRLLIGVKDNGKIAGTNPAEEIHMIEAAADMYCSPKLAFSSRVWQEDMRLVLEITVEKSEELIYSKNEEGAWKVYVRRKDHTLLANKILLGYWKEQKKKHSRPEKFGDNERRILTLLADNEQLTLSQLYKLSGLKKQDVDRMLIVFMCWELIEMEMTEEATWYRTKTVQ